MDRRHRCNVMTTQLLAIVFTTLCVGITSSTPGDAGSNQRKPNIVVLLTDDQDIMLGSMDVMTKTKDSVVNPGASFRNAFVTTPICCPSRSSILTGLYSHNHNTLTNNNNCSSPLWQRTHETRTFATYLNRGGYKTAYFGKYLNEYNGSYIPPGWDYWMGLIRNSKYYNYALNHNGVREPHGDIYAEDYLTDLVANRSIDYFQRTKQSNPEAPILAVLSFPAPHGPEDGAPQYQNLYANVTSHETKSFDYAPNPDKNWLLAQVKGKMNQVQYKFSQMLQQKRLQTLRSVDDNIKRFVDMLDDINELDNTYILYMSDHGYHIGQYALPKGKSLPYDFDARIPFYFRGPNINPGLNLDNIVLNIDVAPTILDLAGVNIPPEMDGTSIMELFKTDEGDLNAPWRDRFLIERGKMPRVKIHLMKPKPLPKKNKAETLREICDLPTYTYPCEKGQQWTCVNDFVGNFTKLRVQKCKKDKKLSNKGKKKCPCSPNERPQFSDAMDNDLIEISQHCGRSSQRSQRFRNPIEKRRYKRRHAQMIKTKTKASLADYRRKGQKRMFRYKRRAPKYDMSLAPNHPASSPTRGSGSRSIHLTHHCSMYLPNFDIRCNKDLYDDPREWMSHMGQLAKSIETLQFKMKYMKTLRQCLTSGNPTNSRNSRRQTPLCACHDRFKPSRPKIRDSSSNSSQALHPVVLTNQEIQRQRELFKTEQLDVFQQQKEVKKLLSESRKEKKERKEQQKNPKQKKCGESRFNCFKLNERTWQVEPTWEDEEQCYCTNTFNNTYWCMRLVNDRMNLLYCVFINKFVEFYNLLDDENQLYNTAGNLQGYETDWLHSELVRLRACSGSAECNAVGSPPPANASFLLPMPNAEDLFENFNDESSTDSEILPGPPGNNANPPDVYEEDSALPEEDNYDQTSTEFDIISHQDNQAERVQGRFRANGARRQKFGRRKQGKREKGRGIGYYYPRHKVFAGRRQGNINYRRERKRFGKRRMKNYRPKIRVKRP